MTATDLARDVRLLVLDVDGVFTDGGLWYDADGRVTKRFDVRDGLGVKMAQQQGLAVAVITGLDHPAVRARVTELGVEDYHAGYKSKAPMLDSILERHGLTRSQAAYVGDDWVDAAPMEAVGLPMAVADARPEIRAMAAWVSEARGGFGAVREAVEFILRAQGKLDQAFGWWKNL